MLMGWHTIESYTNVNTCLDETVKQCYLSTIRHGRATWLGAPSLDAASGTAAENGVTPEMPYYVSRSNCTTDEPSPGWYYSREIDDCGETELRGPFASKSEALDDESDGAYSEWLADKRDDDNYRDDLINAGRGHLLRGDE